MSELQSKPVWCWLPGEAKPVRCGTFSWRRGWGQFTYDPAYAATPGARPLDPVRLPFSRTNRPATEIRQDGLFGIFRDASPEGYGLEILENISGRPLEGPLDRLEASLGDGAGAIEICENIERKVSFMPASLSSLLDSLTGLPEGAPVSRAVRDLHSAYGTSLGGERPKMTTLHEGQLWIAKLQDRGDTPNSPLREYLAMKSAKAVGLDAAEVQFHHAGPHQLVAVRRFDREIRSALETLRHPFASAHTLLHLDKDSTRGDPRRSYPFLAGELQRWCGAKGVDATPMKRELWRRMSFNAICGNGDDHPRNHGVLLRHGSWGLAPAYDIAPYIRFSTTLAMHVTREGHMSAARWALLRDCETFEYQQDEASAFIDHATQVMQHTWERERETLGFKPDDAPTPHPASWLEEASPPGLKVRARRSSRAQRKTG